MFQLPIDLSQLKATNTSESLIYEICHIIQSWSRTKKKAIFINKAIKLTEYYIYEF